jgi:hypothetical protein
MKNRAENRHSTDVKEDANIELKDGSERVKEPVLVAGLDLLLVLLLQAEDDLHRVNSLLLTFDLVRQGGGYYRGRKTAEKTCVVRRTLDSVLIYALRHRLPVDDIGCDAHLIRAHGLNNTENSRADLPRTIADDVVDHFLPAVLTPRFAAIVLTRIGNVLYDALHSPGK